LAGTHAAEIRELLELRGVVAFREMNLSDADQIAFTRTLGKIVDEDKIFKVTMDPLENPKAEYIKGAFASRWSLVPQLPMSRTWNCERAGLC
jgi:hypothetical protein